jgi:hypothetical protein
MMRAPCASNTASKLSVNFRSRSRMRRRIDCGRVLRVHVTCRACCVTHSASGWAVHPATGEFDKEQHVQTAQPHRVDREEIHRDHTRRLCPQELAPCGTPPPSSRSELFRTQDRPDGGRRDDDAEPFQLTNDTLVAPPRIFPCEPKDQRSHLPLDRRPTGWSVVRPPFRDKPAVPTEQRRGRDEKGSPSRAWQRPCGCREEPSVGRPKRRPLHTPAEHRHLVAQDDNFKSLYSVERNRRRISCRTR